MTTTNLKQYYYANKPQLRWSLAILSVLFQLAGLFLDRIIPAGAEYGHSIMFTGFFFGFALLFLSSSIKEAIVNVLFFIAPLPVFTMLIIGLTILISLFYTQNNIADKLQTYISVSAGLIMICFMVAWPYILGPLTLKALRYSKLKK